MKGLKNKKNKETIIYVAKTCILQINSELKYIK